MTNPVLEPDLQLEPPWFDERKALPHIESRFVHAGLRCAVVVNPMGFRCGYVSVPFSHPWFGRTYSDCTLPTAWRLGMKALRESWDALEKETADAGHPIPSLFGASSWFRKRQAKRFVCLPKEDYCDHRPESSIEVHGGLTWGGNSARLLDPNRQGYWWFGFDCAHAGDAKDPAIMHPGYRAVHEYVQRTVYDKFPTPKPEDFGLTAEEAPHFLDQIRTSEYVNAEVRSLAQQLVAVGQKSQASNGS